MAPDRGPEPPSVIAAACLPGVPGRHSRRRDRVRPLPVPGTRPPV